MIAPIITEKIVDLANNTNYCFEVAPQGDGRSRYVDVVLLNNGVPYNVPNNATIVIIEGENAGGYNIYNECIYNDNIITIPLSNGLLSFAGLGKYQISIYGKNSEIITSFKFNIFVTECPYDVVDLMASDSYEALTNLINKVNQVIESGDSATIVYNTNKWIVGNNKPSSTISGLNIDDYYLNSSTGDIYKYEARGWNLTGYNIKEKIYIKYSNNSDGTDFNDNPLGKSYMGICSSVETLAPTDKTAYKWSLIRNGIKDIKQTVISNEDGGVNQIQCILEDGTTLTPWEIRNGSQGVAAGFGTPTYSNDEANGIGDAEVIVTAHGLDTEKIFNFEFRNIKGEQGLRGASWETGVSITGTSTVPEVYPTGIKDALIGDMYLNTDSGYMYKCIEPGSDTVAKWKYVGQIRGTGGGGATLIPGNDIEIVDDTISVTDERYRRKDIIVGNTSHAEGYNVSAMGQNSHAEGGETMALGYASHAEGAGALSVGADSHSEGWGSQATGFSSHAEGKSMSVGSYSHAENGSIAIGEHSHSEGYSRHYDKFIKVTLKYKSKDDDYYVFSYESDDDFNNGTVGIISIYDYNEFYYLKFIIYNNELKIYYNSKYDVFNFENYSNKECEIKIFNDESHGAIGDFSHAEGFENGAHGFASHVEGEHNLAKGNYSHAEGEGTQAIKNSSHAEGFYTKAFGDNSHTEGNNTTANGNNAHAEGNYTQANVVSSHAEGETTQANGYASHAEGGYTIADGDRSHSEGNFTIASGDYSHSEGSETHANGSYSHAEGNYTQANGRASHAEGENTIADGDYSHVEGYYTSSCENYQHVSGQFNLEDKNKIFIVGVGEYSSRKNGFTVDYNGYTYDVDGALRLQHYCLLDESKKVDIYPDIVQYIGETSDDYTYGEWYKKISNKQLLYAWVSNNNNVKYTIDKTPTSSSYIYDDTGYKSNQTVEQYDSSKNAIIFDEVVKTYYAYSNPDKSHTLYADGITVPYEMFTYNNNTLTPYVGNITYNMYGFYSVDGVVYRRNDSVTPVKINGPVEYIYDEVETINLYSYNWEKITSNIDDYTLPIATETTLGGVKVDNESITVDSDGTIHAIGGGSGEGGITNYNLLSNRPSINGVILSGNKTLEELGINNNGIPEDGILKLNSIVMTDESTGVEYKLGINNGMLYIEEYSNNSDETPDNELAPGLYDDDNNLLVSWEDSGINNTCSNAKSIILNNYPNATKLIMGSGVTSISYEAFGTETGAGCNNLKTILISEGVESIDPLAFYWMTGLEKVYLPNTLKNIGDAAFYYCFNIVNLIVPDGVENIGDAAFDSIKHVEYHGSATGSPWNANKVN